ncbi:uncharacterized protein METZ01_LOCUS250949, partial [marine metagenome]
VFLNGGLIVDKFIVNVKKLWRILLSN